MSSLPALAIDNTAPQFTAPPRSVRLSDAEKIAAERLDTASISSLKAALAGVTPADAPPAEPRLVERIDAAARLAADATAAAETVERLKRLLQAQLAASHASEAPEHTPAPLEVVPAQPAAELSEPLSPPLPGEQPRADIRGFLAGFVLSGAIGAVLYLYMMAG
jgi:hypothetical protein